MENHILICLLLIILTLCIALYLSIKANIGSKKQLQVNKQLNDINNEEPQENIKIKSELEARTALLIDVSHEIRSRLHGIVSLSEVLSTGWEDIGDSDRKRHATTISEASSGLISFMNDLLDFSKFNANKMVFNFTELNLAKCIKEVIDYCKKIYLNDKKIVLDLDNGKITNAFIYGDEARINQLIMNLYVNAIKYTEKGKIIAKLNLTNYKGKPCWEFNLCDEGVGIAENELDNIFEPFTQGTKNILGKKIGSGLGLAMCKQIVQAHSGKIWAENNIEKGAKFSFIIPSLNASNAALKQSKIKKM